MLMLISLGSLQPKRARVNLTISYTVETAHQKYKYDAPKRIQTNLQLSIKINS